MTLLIAGLLLFFAVHLLPTVQPARAALVQRLGTLGYKAVFALVSLAAFAMIVSGKGGAPFVAVWDPPTVMRYVTMTLMLPVFVLLLAAYVPCNLRRRLRHPMLLAVKIWATAHLLANGDLASMLLFGSFLAYGVYDRISMKKRDDGAPRPRVSPLGDVVVVVGGLLLYAAVMRYHALIAGVSLIG